MRGFFRCSRGAVSPMVALMLVPILGATALTVDVGYWYYKQRSMQNAADSAALAGAQTPDENPAAEGYDGVNDNFINIAKGTAAKYGYVVGEDSVTVDVQRVACPSEPSEICTQVEIGYTSPLFFSPVVGFQGNQNGAQGVTALAVAGGPDVGGFKPCILALEDTPGEDGILANGVPKADVNGCDLYSNSDLTCNGGNLGAGDAIAVGNSIGCGTDNVSGADPFEDPYDDKAENIPDDTSCSSYPQAYTQGNDVKTNEPLNNFTVSSTSGLSGEVIRCGDVVVSEDVTLTGVTLVIFNGRLITQNNTFTANSSTVVFSGTNDAAYHHYPTDTIKNSDLSDSVVEVSSPNSDDNPWKGVAIYQDPAVTTNVSIDQSGNAPAFNISGLFYAPNSDTELSGIINKAGSGYTCFVLVTNTLTINGTGEIFANATSECDSQGLETPGIGGRPWLVL